MVTLQQVTSGTIEESTKDLFDVWGYYKTDPTKPVVWSGTGGTYYLTPKAGETVGHASFDLYYARYKKHAIYDLLYGRNMDKEQPIWTVSILIHII